jgi:hypothetical protein
MSRDPIQDILGNLDLAKLAQQVGAGFPGQLVEVDLTAALSARDATTM